SRPRSSITPALWETPQVVLSRPCCSLQVSTPGPALHPGCVYRPNSCLRATSLDSAPAQLLATFVGPKLPQAKLSRPSGSSWPSLGLPVASASPHIILKSPSPGPTPASRRPLQMQHRASSGPSRASSCLPSACRGPFSESLVAASPGPALTLPPGCMDRPESHLARSNLCGLSSCPALTSLCKPKPFSSQHSVGTPSAPSGLHRNSSGWRTASAGPCLPPRGLFMSGSHLTTASQGQAPACPPPGSLERPNASHIMACFGTTHVSHSPPRGLSSCLTLASLGRGSPSHWPFGAQLLPLMASKGLAPA
uniref:Uncharacterized protein n=1 Tax=Theropithecus gelada TaxID=9565 RepID=A0A8D2E4P1_THEGE